MKICFQSWNQIVLIIVCVQFIPLTLPGTCIQVLCTVYDWWSGNVYQHHEELYQTLDPLRFPLRKVLSPVLGHWNTSLEWKWNVACPLTTTRLTKILLYINDHTDATPNTLIKATWKYWAQCRNITHTNNLSCFGRWRKHKTMHTHTHTQRWFITVKAFN